jgi:trehalose-6-phosphate synthase
MGKLIVVSSRLPITIEITDDGYRYKKSSGGLVSAINSLIGSIDFVWIGWPGISVQLSQQTQMSVELEREFKCVPVFIPEDIASNYYNGYSNGYPALLMR